MMKLALPGKALQVTGYLLVAIALLAQDWTPLLLLVMVALGGEWRSRRPARQMAGVAQGQP